MRGIVRLSGPESFQLVGGLIGDAGETMRGAGERVVTLGDLSVPVWVYAFAAPHSYTGQHVVEVHLPGNVLLVRWLMEALIAGGARAAEPGEFTARAYFNGRLDLTEAEGVAATIHAHGQAELDAARQLLAGELARRLRPIMDRLGETLALIEVGIDFSEEDVTILSSEQVTERLVEIDGLLEHLLADSVRFAPLTHQPHAVLVGRPNAGKSTLLNALAGSSRAITSAQAGTTRDALSAEVALPRGIIMLSDVAGLEEEIAERIPSGSADVHAGIAAAMRRRAMATVEAADFVLLVQDHTDKRPPVPLGRTPHLHILSKQDLAASHPSPVMAHPCVGVSVHSGAGLEALRATLDGLIFGAEAPRATLALNDRHLQAVREARSALNRARKAPAGAVELLALDLRAALDALGSIVGAVTPDDLLGTIFSTFCIGK